MNGDKSLEKIITQLSKLFLGLAAVTFFGMMLLTVVDVTGRYFARPVTGAYELTENLLIIAVCLGLAYTQIKKEFISIGVIVDRFSHRVQAFIDIFINLIFFILLSLMAWQTFVYAERLQNVYTSQLKLPVSLFVYIAAIGICLFALTMALEIYKSVKQAVKADVKA